MTIDTICQSIRQALEAEAAKEGGPDVDSPVMVLSGFVEEDPVLKTVLLAKGGITIQIKPMWMPTDDGGKLKEQMADLRARAGVDESQLPVGLVQ